MMYYMSSRVGDAFRGIDVRGRIRVIESHVPPCRRNFNYHNDSNEDLRDAIIVNEATELCPSRTLI